MTELGFIHVDMDAFYASCEELENPDLIGKPVIVGGSPPRGVVCSANYAARARGVRNAMSSAIASKLCPEAIYIRPRGQFYSEISLKIHKVFNAYSPIVEPIALDEAFLDISGCERLFGGAVKIGRMIKKDIFCDTGLVASVGIAPNKFLAKLASSLNKPDGFLVIHEDEKQDILDPLPVSKLWGAGKVTCRRLKSISIRTIRDLRETDTRILEREFGMLGEHLARLARGEDGRSVESGRDIGSVGHETTFHQDISDKEQLESVLLRLADQVSTRLRRKGLWAQTVQLKCRFHDFKTLTRRSTLKKCTHSTSTIYHEATRLLRERVTIPRRGVRLLGISTSKLSLEPAGQMLLFEEAVDQTDADVDEVVDTVRNRLGSGSIIRGRLVEREGK